MHSKKEKQICVLGLGYIGLPTACILASVGHTVRGVDTNPEVVRILRSRGLHIYEPGFRELLELVTESGRLIFSSEPSTADVFVLAVPTPLNDDKSANLQYVKAATLSIVPYVRAGNLVILESTVPPGTLKNTVVPLLEKSGLSVGKELFVAHSPERVLPGRILHELVENSRIVGGIDEESTERARELYATFVKGQILCTDSTTAETVKLIENTYRDINIALANELAKICEALGINVWEAIELANYHPRVNVHRPGPGVGGHCIPIDPWFIVEAVSERAQLIRLGRSINDSMPDIVVDVVKTLVPRQGKIAVLGLAFKGNVDDIRESPAITVIDKLQEQGYATGIYDPYVKFFRGECISQIEPVLDGADLVLVLTDHAEFGKIDPNKIARRVNSKLVFDTRNCLNREAWEEAGFVYRLLGDGKSLEIVTSGQREAAATQDSAF